MAEIKVPIQVNLPDDWVEQIVNRLRNDPEAEWVEIIRCKDCRWGREACGNIECFIDSNIPSEYHGYEWFCPNGERRTDGTAD